MFTSSPSRSTTLRVQLRAVAASLVLALVVWVSGVPLLLRVEAVQLTQFSDTISTSAPGVGADHTMRFITPTGIAADGSTIQIDVPLGFDMSTIGEDDVDISDDGVELTTGATCGAVQAGVATSTQTITITICNGGGGAIGALSTVVMKVGAHASQYGVGAHRIVNHIDEGSYELGVTGTMADQGYTQLVIIKSVVVTGQVDTYLDFSIAGVDAGLSVNADATQTTGTSTATSVPFGTLQPTAQHVMAQDLSVITNAVNGFTVTVEASGDLQSTAGATINSFTDGTGTSTPIVWQAPTATVGLPDTYGHWGLTTEDTTLSDNDSFGNALYVGDFVGVPREVFYSTTSANGVAPHIGATRVGYKAQISAMQEAARDYTTTLTYVVTPVF